MPITETKQAKVIAGTVDADDFHSYEVIRVKDFDDDGNQTGSHIAVLINYFAEVDGRKVKKTISGDEVPGLVAQGSANINGILARIRTHLGL